MKQAYRSINFRSASIALIATMNDIVAALNAGGVETSACCCGHMAQDGRIDLADGRILTIAKAGEHSGG